MRGAVMHGPGDVRVEEREAPQIVEPTDAVIRVSAACVCGSDLWPYRGIEKHEWPIPMGHEYAGIVEEIGDAVTTVKPGQFVVGSFWATDNTCAICRSGYQSGCVNRVPMGTLGAQADLLRVPAAHAAPPRGRSRPCGSAAGRRGASRPRTCRSAGGRCRARPEHGRGRSIPSQSSLPGIATLAASGASGPGVDRKLTSRTQPAGAPPQPRQSSGLQGLPMELAGLEPATSWVRSRRSSS